MKLLVATDGSKNALRAVQHAVDLLGKMSTPGSITLLSVHDDIALRHARRFVGKQAIDEYLNELSQQDLVDARKLLDDAGVSYETVVRNGHVATEIAEAGKACDIIVLGSKGRSALTDMVIGSVAKRVIEIATTPVLLVR